MYSSELQAVPLLAYLHTVKENPAESAYSVKLPPFPVMPYTLLHLRYYRTNVFARRQLADTPESTSSSLLGFEISGLL